MSVGSNASNGSAFGEVNRLWGIAFRYLSAGASVLGLIALASLLTFVFWDAFGLWSAGVGWYLTFGATLVVPTAAFGWYARTRPAVAEAALELVTGTVGGLLGGVGAVIVLLVIAGPTVWFAYFLTMLAPAGILYAYGRYEAAANWTGLGVFLALLVGPLVGTLALPVLTTVGGQLGGPGVMFVSVVLPGAAILAFVLRSVFEYSQRIAFGAAVALPAVAIAAVPVIDRVAAVSRTVWLTLLVVFVVPVAVAVANTGREEGRRPAFALPAILLGGFVLGRVIVDAFGFRRPEPWFDWQFLTSDPVTGTAADAGLYPAIVGSVFVIVLVAILTFVLGVGAAIYLEEYAPSSGPLAGLTRLIQINISNLAGVPSVVYGLLGLGIFVNMRLESLSIPVVGIEIPLPFTYTGIGVGTVLTAAFTLSLLILPIVIISAQEAVRAVPGSLRQASYGMGATKWQTVRNVVIPEALPGMLTGTILALGRAIGETAPLIMVGVATSTSSPPSGFFSTVSAMPRQIYTWSALPGDAFQHGVTAAGVVTLLIVLLTMNSVAILLRNKYETEA
ncbi:ABC-type phosphate transport system, permease component [Halorhabdus sp. SVX81]|uniref:phosphate ABC transporter permease PstA n=1 Tax=Halorhabdus sp. SVX81 TaxID=2978283 RepID=UPI0023DC3B98|nr:phosphate ABC transporter permease PstA [Halorhabdus sp. SVX81]WEL16892.1 ABC-type phosphate transport system, permease component [Halorhabdus sp. SVX81]